MPKTTRKIEVPKNINCRQQVKMKYLGNKREVAISEYQSTGTTIIPISRNEYVLMSTGEVREFKHHAANRTENVRNLEKTMKNLGDLINANISPENAECCRFITLTYKENMSDSKRLYQDFQSFNKRFKRHMGQLGHTYEYIITVEAQGRGAFHLHCIFIFADKAPYIANSVLTELWGHGFVSIKAMNNNIDDIGKYLTAYLSDLPIEDTNFTAELAGGQIKIVSTEGKNKRISKGARLKLLPAGMRIYRYSKNIKKPVMKTLTYGEALQELSDDGYSKVAEYALEFQDIERDFRTRYIKQTYKKNINASMKKGGEIIGKQRTYKKRI